MSDDTSAQVPATPPSSGEQTIPKSRLDEEIAKRRQLEQETNWLRNMMQNQQQPRQAQQPQKEPEWLKQMREENPSGYKAFMAQHKRISGLEQATASMMDQTDRFQFVNQYGNAGKKKLEEVEMILQQERSRGNYGYTRGQIYEWQLGRERAMQEEQRAQAPQPPPQAPQVPLPSDDGVPPSNPQNATSDTGSKGTVAKVEKSREERIAEIENIEF